MSHACTQILVGVAKKGGGGRGKSERERGNMQKCNLRLHHRHNYYFKHIILCTDCTRQCIINYYCKIKLQLKYFSFIIQ